MQREEDSGASGPQLVGHTEISDRTRVQPIHGESSDSEIAIIQDGVQQLREDVIQAELRGRGTGSVEFEGPLSWRQDEMRPFRDNLPNVPADPASFLYRGNPGSGDVHDDAPDDAPNGFHDALGSLHHDQASFDSAGGESIAAADGSNGAPNGFNNAADASNLIADGLEDRSTTSFPNLLAHVGGKCVIAQDYRPISVSDDTDTLTTSSPCS